SAPAGDTGASSALGVAAGTGNDSAAGAVCAASCAGGRLGARATGARVAQATIALSATHATRRARFSATSNHTPSWYHAHLVRAAFAVCRPRRPNPALLLGLGLCAALCAGCV